MTGGSGRVQRCYWCPDPRSPSPVAHPDGGAWHRPPPDDLPPMTADEREDFEGFVEGFGRDVLLELWAHLRPGDDQ